MSRLDERFEVLRARGEVAKRWYWARRPASVVNSPAAAASRSLSSGPVFQSKKESRLAISQSE